MYDPSGIILDKAAIMKSFTQGIYDISKASVNNRVSKVNGTVAIGSVNLLLKELAISTEIPPA
jgi:hypothetical protein